METFQEQNLVTTAPSSDSIVPNRQQDIHEFIGESKNSVLNDKKDQYNVIITETTALQEVVKNMDDHVTQDNQTQIHENNTVYEHNNYSHDEDISTDTKLDGSIIQDNIKTGNYQSHDSDTHLHAIADKDILNHESLKLDLQNNLDHEDFSKLLELDNKNDDELFSTVELLQHSIPDHNNVESLKRESTSTSKISILQTPDVIRLVESAKDESMSLQHVSPLGTQPLDSDTKPLMANFPNLEDKLIPQEPQENTPASIIRDRNNLFYGNRHNSLTPVTVQNHEFSNTLASTIPNITKNETNSTVNNDVSGKLSHQINSQSPQVMSPIQGPINFTEEQSKISAYARLDFQNFTFYVQTLQVIIGRRSENEYTHKVDVNLGPSKSISRRHSKIFYNFGTERFELSIIGKNGAFVDDTFIERGMTVPLKNKTKIQIGKIPFQFILPEHDSKDKKLKPIQMKNKDLFNHEEGKSTSCDEPKKKPSPKKKEKKPPKQPKKVYTLEEIPLEYRTKPTCSYSNLITSCLRKFSLPKGMSLSEIYAGIRDLFPYYKYCPDGWQSSVRHNLSLNKSFRKVSKEGKGWLWGLDEEYIVERERQKKKQADAQAAKAKAAELKHQQQQTIKRQVTSVNKLATNIPLVKPINKQANISQTLAANRSERTAIQDANQRTMKYLQEQLIILTKERKGLDRQVMAHILTQALAMTINQVTQAAKNKGITGNPLTALIDKNPQHLNLILAAAVNAATVKVTNGKIKNLVNMPPSNVISSTNKQNSSVSIKKDPANRSSLPPDSQAQDASNISNTSILRSGEPFDPSSLSKFFQPKQANRIAPSSQTPIPIFSSNIPQKRTISETESSSADDDTSSDDDSNSCDSSSNESSDNENHHISRNDRSSDSSNGSDEDDGSSTNESDNI